MSGLLPISPSVGLDLAPQAAPSDAPDASASSGDFASVLALAWAQPAAAAPVADVPTPAAPAPLDSGATLTPNTGTIDPDGSTVGLNPATSIPDAHTPDLGPLPEATFIPPDATQFPGLAGIDYGTPTKPITGDVKGVKAVLAGAVDVAASGPIKLATVVAGPIKQSTVRPATPAATPTKPQSTHTDDAARLGHLEAPARLDATEGEHGRREAARETSEADRNSETARADAASRHEAAHSDSPSSGNGNASDGHAADDRAQVIDRRVANKVAAKNAADAEAVAEMIAGPRKSGTAINASALKPLFDGRRDDRAAAAQKVDAAAADGTSLVAGESKVAVPAATTAAPHAIRSTVSQSFETMLGEAERLGKRETKHLDLHLSPEELGDVDVRLSKDADGRLSAVLVADRESARHALHTGIDALRQSLERAGVAVDRLDVNVSSNGGSAAGTSTGGHGGGSGRETSSGPDTDYLRGTESGSVADDDRLLSIRA